uniref:Ig-like domain-containing protein n=2 Tax=Cyprinus carpio TaxID=7962 RepID=A0A8C0YHV1_CYPCA
MALTITVNRWQYTACKSSFTETLLLNLSFICLFAASTFGNIVYQTPSKSVKDRDTSAVFICTHNIGSYFQMMWYKQTQGTLGFKLMGNLNGETDQIETEFKNKIFLNGNGRRNGTLTIKNLTVDDSAVYFCAAYDTVL